MFETIETESSNKIALWIIGGIVASVAGIAMVAWLGPLWLIPLFILAGAAALWQYQQEWVRVALIYACILSIVIVGAYDVRGWLNQKAEADAAAAAADLAAKNAKIPKPPAGTPMTPPSTTPPATTDQKEKELADTKAELEKMKADIAELRAEKTAEDGGTKDSGKTTPQPAEASLPRGELGGILPEGVAPGEEGSLPVEADHCWYSHIHEMTCKFFIMNKDTQYHTMDVMDSQGSTYGNGESNHFDVWRFGGSIRFAGTDVDERAVLVHNVKNDILATFAEPVGGVTDVSFILNVSGMDAKNHPFTFSRIPVKNIYQ